jgi:cell division protein ZapA
MPEVTISIGGRNFQVACQAGEEHFLQAAAKLLDQEASTLVDQIGRMPEARLLLMSGLLLADKTAALEDQLREKETQLQAAQQELQAMSENPKTIEVPVIPQDAIDSFADIAARAEALAAQLER